MTKEHPALAALDALRPSQSSQRWEPPAELVDKIIAVYQGGVRPPAIADTLTAAGVSVSPDTVRTWLKRVGAWVK